jgi:hypothetical protein
MHPPILAERFGWLNSDRDDPPDNAFTDDGFDSAVRTCFIRNVHVSNGADLLDLAPDRTFYCE